MDTKWFLTKCRHQCLFEDSRTVKIYEDKGKHVALKVLDTSVDYNRRELII